MYATYKYVKKQRAQHAAAKAPQTSPNNTMVVTKHELNHQQQEVDQPTDQESIEDTQPRAPSPSKEEKSATRKYRYKILFALLPPFFIASLDLTVVATALPFIASHFDKFNQLNWIVTAFTLTSTAFIPLFGQLADTFGRHASLQLATWIVTIGSILCAVTPVWEVLILGRALQGIGTAGITNVVLIILADKVSLQQQAVNTSIFQLLAGVGYAVGPVIGGYLTNDNWRYCFVLAAGVGGLSIVTIFLVRKDLLTGSVSTCKPTGAATRTQSFLSGLSTLDIGGTVLFIAGIALIILGTAWGGSTYPWTSAAVLVSLILGALLFFAFIAWEYLLEPGNFLAIRMPKTTPLLPFNLLRKKDVGIVSFIAAGMGAALYSVFYFIGIYFTLVEAYPASNAGVQLLYYTPGIGIGVYSAIALCNFWPRQTFYPLLVGTAIETAGIAALTYAVKSRQHVLVNVMMGLAGVGTGLRLMPCNLHFAGMFGHKLAPAYSLLRFSQPFGGTLALTVMGAVFQNKMARYFGDAAVNGGQSFSLHNQSALDAISRLPAAQQDAIRSTGADATMWAFVSILPILGLSLVVAFGLGNVWIGKATNNDSAKGSESNDNVYLLEIFRGQSQRRHRRGNEHGEEPVAEVKVEV